METSLHIKNWLAMAFEEPVDRLNEIYYFDKRYNQFFSIFITDYFLIGENKETNINSPYSTSELELLKNRIDRIETNDNSILNIPRLTVEERKEIITDFSIFHSQSFDNLNFKTIIEYENGRNYFDLNVEISSDTKKHWNNFKSKKILEKVETFCNLFNINIEAASLWTDTKLTNISFDLKESKSKSLDTDIKIEKKVWWKFW